MDNNGFRPYWFNKPDCYISIVNDLYPTDTFHVLYDGEKSADSYIDFSEATKSIFFNGGSDAHSYEFVLNYVKDNFDSEDIIYIVEDDYLHRKGWADVLREAAQLNNTEYWTLFDHPDKYNRDNISPSKIFTGYLGYWRTAPSTTNTIAFRKNTLLKHWEYHIKWCDKNAGMTWDHIKFLELKEFCNAEVSYPIPGYSTHCDSRTLSPFVNWESITYV